MAARAAIQVKARTQAIRDTVDFRERIPPLVEQLRFVGLQPAQRLARKRRSASRSGIGLRGRQSRGGNQQTTGGDE
jgi:hypothetical protein